MDCAKDFIVAMIQRGYFDEVGGNNVESNKKRIELIVDAYYNLNDYLKKVQIEKQKGQKFSIPKSEIGI